MAGSRRIFLLAALALGLAWFGQSQRTLPANGPAPAEKITPPPSAPPVGVPAFRRDELLAFVAPDPTLKSLAARLPAPARDVRFARVNRALVDGKQSPFWKKSGEGRVDFPLPDGSTLPVVIRRSEMLGAGRFASVGVVEGRPGSRALFTWSEGFLHASILDGRGGPVVLRAATDELAQLYRVDDALLPPCGGERQPVITGAVLAAVARHAQAAAREPAGADSLPTVAADAAAGVVVDVMMVYTQDVLATVSAPQRAAAIQGALDLMIAGVNSDLAASQVSARVRLVKVAPVDYNERASIAANLQTDALDALTDPGDGKLDEVHALRDAAGADLVCLVLNRNDASSSGIAWLIDTPGDTTNAYYGCSVVNYSDSIGTSIVTHELGHGLGCAHDRLNTSRPGARAYSYGYRFVGRDGRTYRTIMAYAPGERVAYFSNPGVTAPAPINAPVGAAAGQIGEADNARSIREGVFEVASFRLQTQAPADAGTLVNVATRAQAGAGARQLIGGFVIGGAAPKRMLVRAAGPALAGFGATDALADPVLKLYRAGATAPFAANDDWGVPLAGAVAAAEIAGAAAAAGAFAFPVGSKDAALLLTLDPGGYTINIEGAGGTTGNALVEAYEVAGGATKLVNLATRAWIAKGGELIGGFVVRGAPGETKRILVRALGPSLADYGLDGAEDPFMALYNSAGELLLENDDWSSGAEGGASPANDFKPFVIFYNEKKIAATGYAPRNRREPCVLLDLPPGAYTAIVRPFEKLDLDPPQVAKPGVAIVEVYEIAGR